MKCLSVLGQYVCSGHRGGALTLLKEVLSDQPKGLGRMLEGLLKEVQESATTAMRLEGWEEDTVVLTERILQQANVTIIRRLDEWSVAKQFTQILDELKKAEAQITTLLRRFQENVEAEWRYHKQKEREAKFNQLFQVLVYFMSFVSLVVNEIRTYYSEEEIAS